MNELLLVVVVQVCLESLPVSSSGHMMLASMLCAKINNFSYALPEHFDHFLHGPTLAILLIFFFSLWWPVAKRCGRALINMLRSRTLSDSEQRGLRLAMYVGLWAFIADVVSVCVYGFGKLLFKKFGIVPTPGVLLVGFCITMLLFAVLWCKDNCRNKNNKNLYSFMNSAFIIGFAQGLALVPGISRFAITFVTARLLGYSPRRAFQVSFVIFIPLVVAGFFVNGVGEFIKHPEWFEIFTPALMITMLFSTIASYALFVLAYRIALARRMSMFGLYMIVPISMLIWLMVG